MNDRLNTTSVVVVVAMSSDSVEARAATLLRDATVRWLVKEELAFLLLHHARLGVPILRQLQMRPTSTCRLDNTHERASDGARIRHMRLLVTLMSTTALRRMLSHRIANRSVYALVHVYVCAQAVVCCCTTRATCLTSRRTAGAGKSARTSLDAYVCASPHNCLRYDTSDSSIAHAFICGCTGARRPRKARDQSRSDRARDLRPLVRCRSAYHARSCDLVSRASLPQTTHAIACAR